MITSKSLQKNKVKNSPTLAYFKDGKQIRQDFGIKSAEELLETSKVEFK